MAESDETVDDRGPFWGSMLTGAVLGLLIGGALGLLYAPKSGREMRGDLEDTADQIKARTEATLDDLQESATRIAERSRALLDETQENIIRSVEAGRMAYEQKRQEMTAQLEAQLRGETETTENAGSGV